MEVNSTDGSSSKHSTFSTNVLKEEVNKEMKEEGKKIYDLTEKGKKRVKTQINPPIGL